MKLVPFVVCILLVLLVTVPDAQSSRGGVPSSWFENIAGQCGQGLVKNWHYAKCKKRGKIPKELNCPDFAYGCGKGRSDAQKSAQDYANTVGDSGCAKYLGHCQINKYTGG